MLACVPGDNLFVLRAVARFAHAARLTALSAHLEGLEAILGPAVLPGRTACWNCARVRRLAAGKKRSQTEAVHAALLASRAPRRARTYLGPMPGALGHALALAAMDLLASPETAAVTGRILVENLITLESSLHAVLPLPECDVCGGAHQDPPAPAGSLDDARSPAELRALLAGVVDARTGIVTELTLGSQDSPHGVDVPIMATAVLASYGRCAVHDHGGDPEGGSGKGLTHVRAMVSAVGEAVERYAAARVDPLHIVRAPASALPGDVLDPSRLCLYADRQYHADFPFVRLAADATLDWTRGTWLDTGEPVYLPALPTYYEYPCRREEYFCQVTSNGLAAGPTFAAAAQHAALELVERDAFLLTWMARLPARRICSTTASARRSGTSPPSSPTRPWSCASTCSTRGSMCRW